MNLHNPENGLTLFTVGDDAETRLFVVVRHASCNHCQTIIDTTLCA